MESRNNVDFEKWTTSFEYNYWKDWVYNKNRKEDAK
jgi:hypothetical protein